MLFKPGDVVRLKSGGPVMTITEPPDTDISGFHCVWFDEGNVYHSHYFQADSLIRLSDGPHPTIQEASHIDKSI